MTAGTRLRSAVVGCPLVDCAAGAEPVGRIEQDPDSPHGRGWLAVSAHQPGHAQLCEGAYRAAQHVLTVHLLTVHGVAAGDMAAWALVADTAHAVKRAALGLPVVEQPEVGECFWCQQRVTRTRRGTWVDAWDSDVCEGTVTICDALCHTSHESGSMPAESCWHCGRGGLVYGPHEPITGPLARWQT